MEEQDQGKPVEQAKTINKSHKRTIYGLIAVLLAGFVVASFLYMSFAGKLSEKDHKIASLQASLEKLAAGSPSDDHGPSGAETATGGCGGGSGYDAEIGKFAIALSNPHVIIRNLDGGFEGGPITSIQVGTCVAGSVNVVDLHPADEVNITGHPASSSSDLKMQYEDRFGLPLSPGGTVSVAGVVAQKYTADSLFSPTVLYFDHDGIGYEIELSDTNATTNSILTDIISDWTFTP